MIEVPATLEDAGTFLGYLGPTRGANGCYLRPSTAAAVPLRLTYSAKSRRIAYLACDDRCSLCQMASL